MYDAFPQEEAVTGSEDIDLNSWLPDKVKWYLKAYSN